MQEVALTEGRSGGLRFPSGSGSKFAVVAVVPDALILRVEAGVSGEAADPQPADFILTGLCGVARGHLATSDTSIGHAIRLPTPPTPESYTGNGKPSGEGFQNSTKGVEGRGRRAAKPCQSEEEECEKNRVCWLIRV